jgi:hypothetical protein
MILIHFLESSTLICRLLRIPKEQFRGLTKWIMQFLNHGRNERQINYQAGKSGGTSTQAF